MNPGIEAESNVGETDIVAMNFATNSRSSHVYF
jgi:hypothetical protein